MLTNENRIQRLEGPDRVRKRPAVVFGSEGLAGAKWVVWELLYIFATEAQLGYCKHLSVTHDGAQITIAADDRGIYLGQETEGSTAWENIFGNFCCLPAQLPSQEDRFFPLVDSAHRILYGDPVAPGETLFPEEAGYFQLYCAQCACKVMDVTSVRKGIKSILHFTGGHNLGGMKKETTQEPDGTVFRFQLDGEVFSETVIPKAYFWEVLDRLAMLSPGLVCAYTNPEEESCREFFYPDGIAGYVRKTALPVYSTGVAAKGRERYRTAEYEARVEIAVGPAQGQGSVRCLHNYAPLLSGGTHLEQLGKCLCRAFNDCYLSGIIGKEPKSAARLAKVRAKKAITFRELSKHLTVVLATWCAPCCTAWENGARSSIRNRMLADMVYDAAATSLCDYVYANKEALRPIVDAIIRERRGFWKKG